MDGSDEPKKQSEQSEPLISKPYPIFDPPIASTSITDDDQSNYLQISYNYGSRSIKDLPFLILFLLFLLSTFGFGIFASVNRNPHRFQVGNFFYNATSASCSLAVKKDYEFGLFNDSLSGNLSFSDRPSWLNGERLNLFDEFVDYLHVLGKPSWLNDESLSLFNDLVDDSRVLEERRSLDSRESSLLKSLIWTVVFTLVLSFPFVLSILFLLKRYTKQVVYAMLPFFVIVPIFINVYWFVACTVKSSCSEAFPLGYRIVLLVFVFLMIGVVVWIFVLNWHRIELTVRIIGVASNALWKNLGLFGVLPALTLSLFVYYVPIIVFLVFANRNGKIVAKEEHGKHFCVWKQDSWVPAYYTLAILTMLWSAAALVEVQVYVLSGTVAQWYFSNEDSRPKRGIRTSLRNAFGPSSGTICFSGLLICIVRTVRFMVDSARQEDSAGIVNLFLRCLVNSLLSAVDFLNKFTINFAAITGEAYCSSARMTYELLKRNLLSAVFVETVSTRILAGIVFVLSAIYAILVCVVLKALVHLGVDAYFVAVMAWIVLIVILGYFVHVLDNVIDTVYVCYAIDRDRGEVYKQDVHEVYVHLPISRSHTTGFVARTPLLV